MCVDLTLFPLDTIKTRLQSQQGFYKAGGFRGIYAGVPSAAVGSFPNGKTPTVMDVLLEVQNKQPIIQTPWISSASISEGYILSSVCAGLMLRVLSCIAFSRPLLCLKQLPSDIVTV